MIRASVREPFASNRPSSTSKSRSAITVKSQNAPFSMSRNYHDDFRAAHCRVGSRSTGRTLRDSSDRAKALPHVTSREHDAKKVPRGSSRLRHDQIVSMRFSENSRRIPTPAEIERVAIRTNTRTKKSGGRVGDRAALVRTASGLQVQCLEHAASERALLAQGRSSCSNPPIAMTPLSTDQKRRSRSTHGGSWRALHSIQARCLCEIRLRGPNAAHCGVAGV
jgi:hypothetical protein